MTANINEVLKIKEKFPNLLAKEIEDIHKMINELRKEKPYINITTKGSSRRQVIIPIGNNNILKFISFSSKHIANINKALKNIKSDVLADFVYNNQCRLVITTNKVASLSDLGVIKRYIKSVDAIAPKDIMAPQLS